VSCVWSLVPPASGGGRQLHVLPPASGGGQVHNGAWKVSECAPHQRAAFHLVAEVIPTSTVRHIASSRRGMLREGPAKVNGRGASIAGEPSPGQFIMFSNKQAKTGHPQQHCVQNSEMLHICHTMVVFRMCGGLVVVEVVVVVVLFRMCGGGSGGVVPWFWFACVVVVSGKVCNPSKSPAVGIQLAQGGAEHPHCIFCHY